MRKFLILIKLCFVLLIGNHLCKAQSQQATTPYVSDELIVKLKAGNSSAKANQLSSKMQAQVAERISGLEVELWKLDKKNARVDILELVEQYKNHPDIEFIEPNYLYSTSEVVLPNDTEINKQWALHNTVTSNESIEDADIDAPEAWEIQSESPSIVVGIIDTGVDWQHPDLINNIWQNMGEDTDGDGVLVQDSLGNWRFDPDDMDGKDNDGNGYIDDFIGWNFVEDNNQPFDYYAVEVDKFVQSHGTHVAGIIGASGNNEIGVSGITQKVKMAPLKFLTDERTPKGNTWDATRAIRYAYKMGMQISNNSWGGSLTSGSVGLAIEEARLNKHLFVTSAGNGDRLYNGINNDEHNYFPANYSHDNIIAVANSMQNDAISNSSNYGIFNVDITAPGTNIYSCLPHNSIYYEPYGLKSGTSMAAPLVTGTLALLWQKNLELHNEINPQYLKQLLLENADTLSQLQLKVANSGRLNAHKALTASIDTTYSNQYLQCRQKDSLTLISIYNAMELETLNFWDYNNEPMEAWNSIQLNSFGCVSDLNIKLKVDKNYPIPTQIGNLKHLTGLTISQYDPYDPYNTAPLNENVPLPLELFSLNKLEGLSLSGYKINGSISTGFGDLKNLKSLALVDNNLSGSLPIELMSLYKLGELNLSNNKLHGTIPTEIENLVTLRVIDFSNNELDQIPGSIGNLNLEYIDLSFNNFETNIPDEIGYISNLRMLFLNDNDFTGNIPGSFSNLLLLDEEYFSLVNNNLSGCYDPELYKMGGYGYASRLSAHRNYNISDGNNFITDWEDFVATGTGSCWASEATQVWPGDLNNDGMVDGDDIVFYGLAKGSIGPTREGSDANNTGNTDWEGQLCPDWDTEIYGINTKHSDANGDGLVDTLDYIVVLNNMDSLNPDHYKGSNDLNYYSNGVQLVLKPVDIDGALMAYDLYLNNLYGDQSTIYGLSGMIEFNNGLSAASMEFTSECIDTLHSYKNPDIEKNRIAFALTQVDDVNVICEDALARILVIVEDAIDNGGDQFVSFKVNGIHTQSNNYGGSVNQSVGATGYSSLSTNAEEALELHLTVSPLLCFRGGTAKAEVYGGDGSYIYEWSTGETGTEIHNLTAGEYSLIVKNGEETKEIVFVVEDHTEPEYDENGELIECEITFETECPEEINFMNPVPEEEDLHIMHHGIYTAAKSIVTDAKIYKREEVELKAGDIITLDAGFGMGSETQLDITIENCGDE